MCLCANGEKKQARGEAKSRLINSDDASDVDGTFREPAIGERRTDSTIYSCTGELVREVHRRGKRIQSWQFFDLTGRDGGSWLQKHTGTRQ